jgi:hypothetical protein
MAYYAKSSGNENVDYPYIISWQILEVAKAMNQVNPTEPEYYKAVIENVIQRVETLEIMLTPKIMINEDFAKKKKDLDRRYIASKEELKRKRGFNEMNLLKIKFIYYKELLKELIIAAKEAGLFGMEEAYSVEGEDGDIDYDESEEEDDVKI